MDFYSVFPHLLSDISPFPRELIAYKKILSKIPSAYEAIPNDKRIFHEMMPIQNTALHNLIAKNLINPEKFKVGLVSRTDEAIPDRLARAIHDDAVVYEEWFQFLVNELPLVSFEGKNGLKSRSDLMEYRYDG
ncbi:MAG: hypothetical protein IPM20_06780 [Gammaproteobacteria bacterium]|nr:hypothetical protein [Gammaproteobacteria bacterium]